MDVALKFNILQVHKDETLKLRSNEDRNKSHVVNNNSGTRIVKSTLDLYWICNQR